MERKTRATGASVLIALGGLLAALMLMAGPAAADGHGGGGHGGRGHPTGLHSGDAVAVDDSTASGGCFAAHGSVCSGSGVAIDNSTSSGDAVALHGSVASGCSFAAHESTASGGDCPKDVHRKPPAPKPHVQRGPGVGEAPEAGAAVAVETTELAFTGSPTGLLAGAAAAALALGSLLVFLGSERRRPAHSS
jgi:hypothetical protein